MTKMRITGLEREDEKARDSYVYNFPASTFYHQIGWRNVVEKTYKHKPIYLIAKEEGEIKGVLPLFMMKSLIFGKKLVSVPFAPYGGFCADNRTIENALVVLYAQKQNAKYAAYLHTLTCSRISGKVSGTATGANYVD